ncbi:SfnB family sulfur acquisition oxidoreductase [Agrobacterium sp. Ap1]|jgi:SfnB family sulfur acquisition oxidoreductase|uniref:SfnB family sulfur acquisition oxidoreductase n=1 Tax=Agrobacterium sp. Ap1 TaxID=2815337 RepID=UPI001A8EA5F0|nr:SfnB family sulfur acquisition oxidoreductase [Agrobacterium sp. Ap1]MBO0145034.1 SfnB family sulfur acquisition oxidoreductase [Agrobacterium sp. Ap1]
MSSAPIAVPATHPATSPHLIKTDAEAVRVATEFAKTLRAGASERDAERRLPWQELDAFVATGLWGISVPKAYGGAGVSSGTLAKVTAIIGAADGSLSQIPQNHYYALEVLRVGGSAAQKRFFYDKVLAGERLGNALAEIGHKDFKRRTRLVEEDGKLFVEGTKYYCTGAIYAHWIPTLVTRQEDGADRLFIVFVPRTAPGVTIYDDWDGFGQRVTGSGTVRFEHVAVEGEWILPFQASFERPTSIGPLAQIIHAAIDLGIGQGAYRDTLEFVRSRARAWIDAKVESAGEDPLTLSEIGKVRISLRAAEALVERAARLVDAAMEAPDEANVAAASIAVAEAKILTTKAGLLAANKLFELSGTSSTMAEDNYDRHWRNVRTHTLHDPVRWKYQAIGQYYLNGRLPRRHGAI